MDNKINNSYYECKRCFHKFYQKNDMKKHLDKKKICSRTFESYKYNDEELYDLSLERIKNNETKYICTNCNKNYNNNNNLIRHIEKYCKKTINDKTDKSTDEKINTSNIQENVCKEYIQVEASNITDPKPDPVQIGSNNNINSNNIHSNNINSNNNINININITKSFDDEWDTSGIDINKKFFLLFANSKFTKSKSECINR